MQGGQQPPTCEASAPTMENAQSRPDQRQYAEYVWDRRTDPERLGDPNYGLSPLRNPVNGDYVPYCCRCGAIVWDEYSHDAFHGRYKAAELPPSAALCVGCGHWADWHHKQPDGTYPCIGGCGCLDYRDGES